MRLWILMLWSTRQLEEITLMRLGNISDYHPQANILSCMGGTSLMALGHKRLSIIDTSSAGHQPMSYSSARYWIVLGDLQSFEIEKNWRV